MVPMGWCGEGRIGGLTDPLEEREARSRCALASAGSAAMSASSRAISATVGKVVAGGRAGRRSGAVLAVGLA